MSNPSHVWHGVAVGWRSEIGSRIQPLESTYERIAGVRMSLSEGSLLLVSFYAPTSGHDEDFLESISSMTEYLRANISTGDKLIIGADSNCSIKSSPRRQLAWKNLCDKFDLKSHAPPLPTFHHHNGSSNSSIDLFAASTTLNLGETIQYCTLETPLNLSSHDPIKTSISIDQDTSAQGSKFSHTYTDFKRQKILWDSTKLPEYQQLAERALSDAISYWDTPETIPLLSSLLSSLLVSCASQVFDSKSPSHKQFLRQPSKAIKQAQYTLSKSFAAWKEAGKPDCKTNHHRKVYNKARANLQRISRYEQNMVNIRQKNVP